MNIFKKFSSYIKRLPRRYSIGGAVVIVVAVILIVHLVTRAPASTEVPPEMSHVRISSVASLSSATGPLPVTGKVTSLSEATILAQSAGEVVSLNRALGDHVSAGQVIASLENSSQQAAVLQSQGAYDAAEAALAKASGSTASNTGLTSAQAAAAAQNAQIAAAASLQSAYAALDDAVHAKADVLFSNPRLSTRQLVINVPDSQLTVNVVNERSTLEDLLTASTKYTGAGTSASVDSDINNMIASAQTVSTFLTDAIKAVNIAQPSQNVTSATLAADQASLGAARTEVVSSISALTAAKSAYDAAQSAAQTTANTAGSGLSNDIAVAQANVKQALGALNSAKANLEKTIIRSPISGTIVTLSITKGDFVPAFSQVAAVSNPSALEVDAYVTPDDAKTLTVGGKAVIDGTVNGVIVSISPALDPTNNKIQVKIGISGDQSALTDGDTVTVDLARSTVQTTGGASTTKGAIMIPIVSAKITPNGPVVFTVSSSTLVAIPITLGPILGDQVTVLTGITLESDIVADARGLTDGQVIVVDTQ